MWGRTAPGIRAGENPALYGAVGNELDFFRVHHPPLYQQKAVQIGLAPMPMSCRGTGPEKWNSKHNRYFGGLLIRSPMDFGV